MNSGDLVSIHMRSILALSSQIHIYTMVSAIPGILLILMDINMGDASLILFGFETFLSTCFYYLDSCTEKCINNRTKSDVEVIVSRKDRKITGSNCQILVHV
jgi:hypothetical protein